MESMVRAYCLLPLPADHTVMIIYLMVLPSSHMSLFSLHGGSSSSSFLVSVVFGKVVEGMATVKRMEVVGSRSGKTSRKVIIADCGQVE